MFPIHRNENIFYNSCNISSVSVPMDCILRITSIYVVMFTIEPTVVELFSICQRILLKSPNVHICWICVHFPGQIIIIFAFICRNSAEINNFDRKWSKFLNRCSEIEFSSMINRIFRPSRCHLIIFASLCPFK